MVTETDWAWLAGMMNGDGCFSLKLRKREERWKCDVSITLTQCDPAIIERASEIMIQGMDCNPSISEYEPSGAGVNTKFNLRITKMSQIARFIENIIKYMCGVKLAKAKLMLRYVNNRIKYEGQSRRVNMLEKDPEAIQMASEFYQLCGSVIPKELTQTLRDYPAREYGQVTGSA